MLTDHLSIPCTHPHIQTNGQTQSEQSQRNHTSEAQNCSSFCQVQSLNLTTSNILNEGTIIKPTEFNVGMCKGSCEAIPPDVRSSPAYNNLFHSLIDREKLDPPSSCSNVVSRRYCTPAGYRALTVLTQITENVLRIHSIPNMIIDRCHCIEVIEFQEMLDGSGSGDILNG